MTTKMWPAANAVLWPTRCAMRLGQWCRPISSSAAAAASAASPTSSLADWVCEQGGQAQGVEIVRSSNAGYGLVASRELSPGQKLVQLPARCQLTYDDSSDPRLLKLISQVPKELWGAKLALQLLAHRVADENSFAQYVSQLPSGVNVPMFSNATGQAAIQYPPVAEQVKKRCRWLYEISTKVLARLPGTPEEDPFNGVLVDINALGWALACVNSRAFRVRGPKEPAAMLPLIDMCNHSFDPNCEVLPVDGQKGAIAMFAKRKIAQGEPLLLSYGNLSNDFLFMDYGFVLPSNPHDRVAMRWSLDLVETGAELGKVKGPNGEVIEQLSLAPWKKKWLTEVGLMGPDSNLEVNLGGAQLLEPRLLAALRVVLASSEAEVQGRSVTRLGDLSSPLSRASEVAALRTAMGMALLALANFPTNLEDDMQLLDGKLPASLAGMTNPPALPLPPDLHLAVTFRAGKKSLLAGLVRSLGQRLQELKSDINLPATTAPAELQKGQKPVPASSKGFGTKK